jgi:tetratricopeptide (TPR) repeat protein
MKLFIYSDLALLYDSQGRYGEAEPLYRQALEIRQSALGEDHPSYGTSLHNLAGLYESQERYGEAEPLYRQALEIMRSALGEDHPSYATSLGNLAVLYKSQGRYREAESLYRQSLEIRRSALGEDHPDYATSLGNLATLYSSSFNPWKWIQACHLSIQTIRIDGKALGWKHPSIRIDVWNLLSVCLLPALFIWILSQGFFLSLKTHNLLHIAYSILIVFLMILFQRSNLETRFWAKAKYKLSRWKGKK